MLSRVSLGCHLGCNLIKVFRVSFVVSLVLIHGFFRVHLGLHVGFLIRICLGFLWISPRVSPGFHLGYKQNRIKQKKMKDKETKRQEAKKQRSRK